MEMRRRRSDESHAASAAAGVSAEGVGAGGSSGAADAAEGMHAASAGSDGAAGGCAAEASGAEREIEKVEETALIGQEMVVVESHQKGVGNLKSEPLKEKEGSERFQSPGMQKPLGSPDQLQLENTPYLKANDESEKKSEHEKGGALVVPNGPPQSYGPPSVMSPLFTPEQIANATDPRNTSSLLPMTREPDVGSDLSRLPGFLQGLLPGFDHLQEARHREMEWRARMEMMVEQLGLQLRASHSENVRLRQELLDARKESSKYGTPEEDRFSEKGEVKRRVSMEGNQNQEDGVAARQDLGRVLGSASSKKTLKEDGTRVQQVLHMSTKEDGTRVQQAFQSRFKEDGTRVQQVPQDLFSDDDQSDQTPSPINGAQEKEDGPESQQNPDAPVADQTMQVLLKIVQGMQTMQKQILEGRDDHKDEAEFVRYSPDLPRLQEWSVETAPIDFGDWITCLHTYMSDLSPTSEQWWDLTLDTAKQWYVAHMSLTPIQRLSHHPAVPDSLKQRRWGRLERRAASLLMAALPEQLREEVISSKSVTALGIIAKAMLSYQPGGLTERSAILSALESPPECNTVSAAMSQLRKWIRWKRRATEVGVAIPDASILMRGLGRIVKKIVLGFPELSFRLSLVRSGLLVDTVPTHETVSQYSEHLLAEMEQMGQQAKKKDGHQEGPPKLRKFEESSKTEDAMKASGRSSEESEQKKKPCRFFNTDNGCKRGKSCQFLHNLDGQRRCWTCGSKGHLAPACNRSEEGKHRAAKMGAKPPEKDGKSSSSPPSPEKPEEPPESTDQVGGDDTMKVLIDEANRMLKSLQQSDPKEKQVSPKEDKMAQLQKQLDELKKATMKPFRLSRMGCSKASGLLDSGATHPLRARRKGEEIGHLPRVQVTLAGEQQVTMHLSPTGVIIGGEGAEPIVPMGILATSLKCDIRWSGKELRIIHPKLGELEVKIKDGCPMVDHDLALKLIAEIEAMAGVALRSMEVSTKNELQWLQRLVNEHPVFAGLPSHIKQALIEVPAADLKSLGNRRMRKLWGRNGVLIHAFSGEDSGYTLKRAFHEVGGDKRLMCELDLLHGRPDRDLSPNGQAYPTLFEVGLRWTLQGLDWWASLQDKIYVETSPCGWH